MNTTQEIKHKFADLTTLKQLESLITCADLVQCTAILTPQIAGELGDAANQLRLVLDLLQRMKK